MLAAATTHTLPAAAATALRAGRTTEAIRIVRNTERIGLKEAKARVDQALASDPALRSLQRPGIAQMLGDYLAQSWKTPLAAGFALAFCLMYLIASLFPDLIKKYDVGMLMVITFTVPFVLSAAVWFPWSRAWRRKRAMPSAAAPIAPPRPRFGGLPSPRSAAPGDAGLPHEALAALDRDDPIAAIKIVRAERGLGLAQAKALVDKAIGERRK